MEGTRHSVLIAHRGQVLGLSLVAIALTASVGLWLAHVSREARAAVARVQTDAGVLRGELSGYDLIHAGPMLTKLRLDADAARADTSDPSWRAASWTPVFGRDLGAVTATSASLADVADTARPLESLLPRLDPSHLTVDGGRIDTVALTGVAQTMPALSQAVDRANKTMAGVDSSGLRSDVASAVRTMRDRMSALSQPLDRAVRPFSMLPSLVGAHGERTYLVILQQDAEARGTGGLMGSFAIITADHGALTLVSAEPRGDLQQGGSIPVAGLPQDVQDLWGSDLSEWAGLNLSPHFPYTGQLVAAGWDAQHPTDRLDGVIGVDQDVVAALLAGTGPVHAGGVTLNSQDASAFLSRGVYGQFNDPSTVDLKTAELVQQTFEQVVAGHLNLGALIRAMGGPYAQRRLLFWSAHSTEQAALEGLSVAGAIPDQPGPFAMAVVNNGGGNKLDAYLSTGVRYDPGQCTDGVRSGHITVTLTNQAPSSGLPDYVSVRSDLLEEHKPNPVVGSNRILLDVYGPVGAQSPLATLDGVEVPTVSGVDRNHSVWRVIVPINPGQTRTVDVTVVQPGAGDPASLSATPVLLAQPMVNPVTTQLASVAACVQ